MDTLSKREREREEVEREREEEKKKLSVPRTTQWVLPYVTVSALTDVGT